MEAIRLVCVLKLHDTGVLHADERCDSAERFAEAIGITQWTLKKLELGLAANDWLDVQAHADGLLLELQAFEVRVQKCGTAPRYSPWVRGW